MHGEHALGEAREEDEKPVGPVVSLAEITHTLQYRKSNSALLLSLPLYLFQDTHFIFSFLLVFFFLFSFHFFPPSSSIFFPIEYEPVAGGGKHADEI